MADQGVSTGSSQPGLFDRHASAPESERVLNEAEQELLGVAGALIGPTDALSLHESRLVDQGLGPSRSTLSRVRRRIRDGHDPLGDMFCELYDARDRRPRGATYTPQPIVHAMVEKARKLGTPARVIDPGAGSARFLVSAGRAFPQAELVAVESDPFAALLARAHLRACRLHQRSEVLAEDFRSACFSAADGPSLFIGNPPYVRHHGVTPEWKQWLVSTAASLGLAASQLSGLHAHFYLATRLHARDGDRGVYITSSEWLDVNYGRLIRELLLGPLGGRAIMVIEPEARPFPDAVTTGVVTQFVVGEKPRSVAVRRVSAVSALRDATNGRPVRRERFESENRWSHLTRRGRQEPGEFVELGELCRVHRGTATGANRFWIEGDHAEGLPDDVFFPSVTRARELFEAGAELNRTDTLRRVIDLPRDLDEIPATSRPAVDRFIRSARRRGVHQGYIASSRRAWWSVGLREPAPILATYMARRPPAFVRNSVEARHINIAHGLYPREPMTDTMISRLAAYLSKGVQLSQGRTYAGGLTKFEPREMERLLVPPPSVLA